MKKYLLHIFLVLSTLHLYGQEGFRFRNFTINDGLSQSSVTCMVQDELNALWIGTQDGLNRYDGKTFEVFTSDQIDGLESEYIKCSSKDESGNLWFGTNNGLTKYDIRSESFKTYFVQEGIGFQIEDITIQDEKNIWIASTENGLFRFSLKTEKITPFGAVIPSGKTSKVAFLGNETVLIATEDKGLFLWEIDKKKAEKINFPEESTSPRINQIVLKDGSDVFLAASSGVFQVSITDRKATRTFKNLFERLGNISVSDVYYHRELGWLFATNTQGLYVQYENGEVHHSTEDIFQKTALLHNELSCLYEDNGGTLWVGSRRGMSNFDPINQGFLGVGATGNTQTGIPTPGVWSFAEDKEAKYVYVGTDAAVSRYSRSEGIFEQYYRFGKDGTKAKSETSALAIEEINKNLLLIGCADGLFELSINEGGQYRYKKVELDEKDRLHGRAYSIEHWSGNDYLIATRGGGMLYNVDTKKVIYLEHDPENAQNTITKGICRLVHRDRSGRVWLSTSTGGLNYAEQTDEGIKIHPYKYNAKLKAISKDYITSLTQTKNGDYWMGTLGSGLIHWNEKKQTVEVFNKSHGLPNDVIYGVVEDEKSHLWLTTNKGLCTFDPSSGKAKNYTEIDGLMSNEFNLGAYMRSSSGELFFGGIYGYNSFNPSKLLRKNRQLQVVFTKFKLENEWLKPNIKGSPLNKPIFLTREIDLNYRNRSFTIKFQSSDLGNPELINYKYLLDGSDQGEIYLETFNEIHFNALEPGTYTLKVFARLGDGKWSDNPAELIIRIAAPFWQTVWFWLMVAIFVALFVRWFIRKRIETSEREQIRLEMKVRERTHEIKRQSRKIEQQKRKIEEEKEKVEEQQKLLQIEKDKTEKLLKNVIPESTAEELKKKGKARARAYKKVSVLFTDFVGFSKISESLKPSELVKKLDVYFTKFDEIIVNNNLEKIKTIGDAYMCAGGVPVRNNTNPIDTCLAALQIQAYMRKRKNDAIANGREYWELRLGINTGEVTAGVIGSERLAYDVWGSTVNQAQRMEMLGEPEKVTVTGATFVHIEPYFECIFKGQAQSKSKGMIDMYVVERIKPELSVNGEGIIPNDRFQQIVNLHLYSSINYYKAERHIMRLLEQHLSKQLHYHSIAHTKDVVSAVERIALLENVTDEGLFLLKSAATYHDAGFVEQYDANEPIGARLAEEILPKYGYTEKHIDLIKELIFVTQIPHQPKNQLEEIMCDADLDYLGRDDFHEIADKLRRELREHGKINSDRQWDEIQVSFLKSHKYFTKTARKTRQKKKKQNLQEIIERLERDEYAD